MLSLFASVGFSTLVPGDLFRDHAVFQTTDDGGTASKFVGLATPGSSISLKLTPPLKGGKDSFTATTDTDGFWRFDISSPADGPFTMQLSGDGGDFKISDAWFGDVYLCGGQSNMQYPTHMLHTDDRFPGDQYQNVRLFSTQLWGKSGGVEIRKKDDYAANRSPQQNLVGNTNDGAFTWNILSNDTVENFSAVCYLTGRDVMLMQKQTGRAIGLVSSTVGGTPIQAWVPTGYFESCQFDEDLPNFVQGEDEAGDSWDYPSMLYNQMIAPLVNTSYRGVMWYQGEANMDEGYALAVNNYECLFRNLIAGWREAIGQPELPFVFMQLAACGHSDDYEWRWAELREAQARVDREVHNVGMGISFDHGFSGIHTPYKIVPSQRLAYQLANIAFGADVPKRPRITGACAAVLGGRYNDTTNITVVQVKVKDYAKPYLNGTVNCGSIGQGTCCKNTKPGLDGIAFGIGQITTATTKGIQQVSDATVELNDEGFLLRAKTGDTSKVFVWTVHLFGGSYPQCGIYSENGMPVPPVLDLQVSPACDFETAEFQRKWNRDHKKPKSHPLRKQFFASE